MIFSQCYTYTMTSSLPLLLHSVRKLCCTVHKCRHKLFIMNGLWTNENVLQYLILLNCPVCLSSGGSTPKNLVEGRQGRVGLFMARYIYNCKIKGSTWINECITWNHNDWRNDWNNWTISRKQISKDIKVIYHHLRIVDNFSVLTETTIFQ